MGQRCASQLNPTQVHRGDRLLHHVQGHDPRVASTLGLADPRTVAFAPNTHEFVRRLLSACPPGMPRVLTTDGEFHSLSRQLARLEEDGLVAVTRIPVRPFATFVERFSRAARQPADLVFLSQVFFGSGWAVPDLATIVASVPDPATLVAIDGYHGFMALPTDLSTLQDRVFYLAGGYKYAMSGEGCCFIHCPPGHAPRPRDTGWYAAFGALAAPGSRAVPYAEDGSRFMGATFDPTGLYRFVAVMDWFAAAGLDVNQVHARAHALQRALVAGLEPLGIDGLREADLLVRLADPNRGNFLAYDSLVAPHVHEALGRAGIVTDLRGNTLRIGFGLYHDLDDIPAIVARIAEAVRPRCVPAAVDARSAA